MKRLGKPIYVDALHLLALCQKLVREAAGGAADGAGTPENPYTMKLASQWISRWRVSSTEKDTYYKMAGRLILKNAKLYMGDVGPAYLKGKSREESLENAKAQYISGSGKEAEEAWLKRNTIDDPTYRSGAQKILDPGLIYEESTKALEASGGARPAPWKEIKHSPILAGAIRKLMCGEALSLGGESGKYDRNYSRKQFMLPVFTLAIFHAEPARNERAWPINLMLLDLAEAMTANFTWDAILWHPEAINPAPNRMVIERLIGPKGKNPSERGLEPITSTDKLHLVGGILPASPTGGGERGKPSLYKPPKELTTIQVNKGMQLGPGTFLKIPFDFIHQKEIDVLLKWLFHIPAIQHSWSLVEGDKVPEDATLLEPGEVLGAYTKDDPGTSQLLGAMRDQIKLRISSLDRM
jgi:hypothetical protein